MTEWISVKTSLPKDKETVVVTNTNGDVAICTCNLYEDNIEYNFKVLGTRYQVKNVTHWQYLPPLPEE